MLHLFSSEGKRLCFTGTNPRCRLSRIVPGPIRCFYCAETMQSGEMTEHLHHCRVRRAALEAEAKMDRILTDEEIAAIRERFS